MTAVNIAVKKQQNMSRHHDLSHMLLLLPPCVSLQTLHKNNTVLPVPVGLPEAREVGSYLRSTGGGTADEGRADEQAREGDSKGGLAFIYSGMGTQAITLSLPQAPLTLTL